MKDIAQRETLFTKIVKGEIPSFKIYEDEDHFAFLDIVPFEKGHTLVIPKIPYETIMEMPEQEYVELQKVVRKLAIHYEKTLGCGINIWQNNKEIAGQEVPHVHFHIVPRRRSKNAYVRQDEKYLGQEMINYSQKLKL
jgi:histidine triad (HIT) family protein